MTWVDVMLEDCVSTIERGLDHSLHNAPVRVALAKQALERMAMAVRRLERERGGGPAQVDNQTPPMVWGLFDTRWMCWRGRYFDTQAEARVYAIALEGDIPANSGRYDVRQRPYSEASESIAFEKG